MPGRRKYQLTNKDREAFETVITDFYLKPESTGNFASIPDAVQELYERFYTYVDGNGKKHILPEGEKPTQRQFEHYLRARYSLEVRIRGRKGDKAFERDHRPKLSTLAQICHGSGHIYELDATTADKHLVSKDNRADLIGKPTLYYIVDKYADLIVGWYLGLENPSWQAALQAIFSIAEDKQQLCERLSIPYDPEDWPADGIVSQELHMDRGEGIGREPTKLCSATATTVTNLPSLRPDWKPRVEGKFAWTHREIAADSAGYQPSAFAGKRRTKDLGLSAELTLEEFERAVVLSIIAHNRRIKDTYPMTREQIAAGVQPSPINIWNHSVVTRVGQLSRYSADVLRLHLLPKASAAVDEEGIFVNNCYYKPESVDRRSWFVEGRVTAFSVAVTYDKRRVDKIFVQDKREPCGYFVAVLSDRSRHFAGLSVDEVAFIVESEKVLKAPARQSKAQTRMEARDAMRPVYKRAKEATAEAMRGKSRRHRRDNVVDARATALNAERDARAFPDSSPTAAPTAPGPVASQVQLASSNVVRLHARHSKDEAGDTSAAVPTTPPSVSDVARRMRDRMLNG